MPLPIDSVGSTSVTADQLANAVGFSRSRQIQAGPAALGRGAEYRDSQFGDILSSAINNLQAKQQTASDLAVQAVTGQLDDVHDYTIAAAESRVTFELTAAIRNKAVDAFNEIMRMQA